MGRGECPPTGELARLLADDLPVRRRQEVTTHLEACAACQGRLDRLLSNDSVASWGRATSARAVPGPDRAFLEKMRALVPRVALSPVSVATAPPRPVDSDDGVPAVVGGYEILGVLGRGGMAVVYKARQPRVGRVVALKRLRSSDHDPADVARFLREAEAAAGVRHPNVVQVYEVGDDAGRPFIALEYVDGGTLADALTGAPVDPRAAAGFIEKAAGAVHAAHRQGVIHRDLKPANILLATAADGPPDSRPGPLDACEPKVTDFGLARRLTDDRRLTLPDMLAGTPAYLAPEQVSRPTDAPAPAGDVYALGAILYEMLTGRPPLLGPTVLATLRLVEGSAPVPPRRLHPGLPRDLEAVCLKCLEKDPRGRYATAAALADDLHRFLAGQPTAARPVSAVARFVKLVRRRPALALMAVVLVASLAAGLAGVLWQWRAAVAARGDLQIALAAEADQRRDAEENLYHGRLAQATLLWESGDASQARGLLAACRPGERQADFRGWEWRYLGRQFRPEAHVVRTDHWVNGLAALPVGGVAVAVGRPLLNAADRVMPGDGRAAYLRFDQPPPSLGPGPDLPGAATAVAVHPRGSFVAWGTNTGDVVLARGAGRQALRVIHTPAPVLGLGFGPAGDVLYATGEDLHLRAFDPPTGDMVHDQVARVGRPSALAVDPVSGLVACGGTTGVVRLFDPKDRRPVVELTGHGGGAASLCFSPDGKLLAAGCGDGKVVFWDPTAGREVRRIQTNGGSANALAFRPDGKAVAVGGPDRAVRLYDLTSDRLRATYRGHDSSVRSLAFAADGGRLISGGQDGTVRVWDATRDVRGRLIAFDGRLNDAAFLATPDGLRVVAASGTGRVQSWDVTNGRTAGRCDGPLVMRPPYPRRYMAFVRGGRHIVGIEKGRHSELRGLDSQTGERQESLVGGRGPVQVVAADPSGAWVTWATSGGKAVDVHVRNLETGSQPGPVSLPTRSLLAVAIDPAGRRAAAVAVPDKVGSEQAVWVWDGGDAIPPRTLYTGAAMFGGLAFSPDGRLLAVADYEAVRIFRTETWDLAFRIPIPRATTCLTFSPDGRRLAAVGYDGDATLIDPAAGKRVFQLRSLAAPRPDEMACDARVAFSPDGAWLVSTNWDGSINLWDGSPVED